MKIRLLIIIGIIAFILISFAIPNLHKIYDSCEMTQDGVLQFAIGYQWTNGFLYIDNAECTWKLFGIISIVNLLSEEEITQPEPEIESKHFTIEELLIENQIEYLSDKLVVISGISFQGDPGCGAVIDIDSQTHWFGIDSRSEPKKLTLFSENPNQCKVNTSSCFCNVQMKLTAMTLDNLNYFTPDEQKHYADILIDYLYDENINRTPKFQIGKINLNYTDSSAIGYCGEIWGTNTRGFFSGAIVNGVVEDYGIDKELPLLCAISDDAKWWENEQ